MLNINICRGIFGLPQSFEVIIHLLTATFVGINRYVGPSDGVYLAEYAPIPARFEERGASRHIYSADASYALY